MNPQTAEQINGPQVGIGRVYPDRKSKALTRLQIASDDKDKRIAELTGLLEQSRVELINYRVLLGEHNRPKISELVLGLTLRITAALKKG